MHYKRMWGKQKKIALMYVHVHSVSCARVFVVSIEHISAIAIVQRGACSPKFKFSLLPIPNISHANTNRFWHVSVRAPQWTISKQTPFPKSSQCSANIHFGRRNPLANTCSSHFICNWHVQNSHFHSTFHVKSYLINFFSWTECDSFIHLHRAGKNGKQPNRWH